jgi:hypothetical protein
VAEFGSTIPPEAAVPDAGAAGVPPAVEGDAGAVVAAAGGAVAVLIAAVSVAVAAVSVESAFFIVQAIVATTASEATNADAVFNRFIF